MSERCIKCGKCCYQWVGEARIKCKHLIIRHAWRTNDPEIKTYHVCRIWTKPDRLGTPTGVPGFKCMLRQDDTRVIEGCPYNPKEGV